MAEITVLSVILGVLVGLVMSVANVYLGLFAGMTVSASNPAAVISMGLLKGVLRRGTILENNIVQTMASTGESAPFATSSRSAITAWYNCWTCDDRRDEFHRSTR